MAARSSGLVCRALSRSSRAGSCWGRQWPLRSRRGWCRSESRASFRARDRIDYALEYGTDALEMHRDAVGPGDRVC
jgi:hypothetical protein